MDLSQSLAAKHTELLPHFKPAFLQTSQAVFQFRFDDDAPFYLVVTQNGFELIAGSTDDATLTLFIDSHETCWGLLSGRIDGMQAFMDGRYKADGNIVLSQLLLYLFRVDDPTIAYQVQD